MKQIAEHANVHWALLEEQFRLYKPDITICGGVFGLLKDITGAAEKRDDENCFRYFEHPDLRICFDFYHPQSRLSTKQLFEYIKQQFNYHLWKKFRIPHAVAGPLPPRRKKAILADGLFA